MTDTTLRIIAAGALAYLLGSVPTGMFVVQLMARRDLRKVGSGRTGGTNAMRAAGLAGFLLTGVGDIIIGWMAVLVGQWLVRSREPNLLPWVEVMCGVLAVVGHNWSVFLSFKGGAGTSTSVGAVCAFWPVSAPIWIILVLLLVFGIGYASVASLTLAFLMPVALGVRAWLTGAPWQHTVFGIVAAILTTWALAPNIKRLAAGTERRTRLRSKEPRQ